MPDTEPDWLKAGWTPPEPQQAQPERLVEVIRRGRSHQEHSGPAVMVRMDGDDDRRCLVMFLKEGFPCEEIWSSNLRACDAEDLTDQEAAMLAEHRLLGISVKERADDYLSRDVAF